ncbi:MAG: hypothetical protein ACO1SV_16060 [Fimbriimonas sp.]
MRSVARNLASVAVLAFVCVGCMPRFQGAEGFTSATTPVDYKAEREKPGAWKGDPYAFGGAADASGGLKPQTSYGRGARPDAAEAIDPKLNQPAKGTGQHAGEYPAYADPSHGNSNAPAAQPQPGAIR